MKTVFKNLAVTGLVAGTTLLASCAGTGGTGTASSGNSSMTMAAGVKPYPLKTCIVTDNDLGSMGGEQRMVYQGQEIKFCCKPCEAKFLKEPQKYLQKI